MTPRKLALERLEGRALLAVYTVDYSGTPNPDDGLTSFLEALDAANLTVEADVIEFSPSLAGSSIELRGDSTPDNITWVKHDLEIRGLGSDQLTFIPPELENSLGFAVHASVANVTISGVTLAPRAADVNRAFYSVVSWSTGDVRLEDVIATGLLQSGILASGGSVTLVDTRLVADPSAESSCGVYADFNHVTVRLERSEVSGFALGGVRAEGDVAIVDSTISDNGSGVRSTVGLVEVVRSIVTGNLGGGGIWARSGVTLVDSTISDNTAQIGGGVFTQDGSIFILRSTLRDNTATGGGGGGAYNASSMGTIAVTESVFSGNRNVSGDGGRGAGFLSRGQVVVIDSKFLDNHANYEDSAGGAIYAAVGGSISRSLFEGNSVAGRYSDGGAIWSGGHLTINATTFRNNSTNGFDGDGGAIYMGDGSISNSTFVGNQTLGVDSDGGAIARVFGPGPVGSPLVITNTTIVDNATIGDRSDGGGIYFDRGKLEIRFSTIAGNRVQAETSRGGGVSLRSPAESGSGFDLLTFWHSIVSDNSSVGGNPDLYLRTNYVTSNYSLIENTAGLTTGQLAAINAGAGNILGVDPLLAPLADNGGPTLTRALLPGSPAIEAGDPAATYATPNLPRYDQRGFPYDRIAGALVDLGAVETQPTPAYADFDHDFDVDGADVLAWQRGLGTSAPDGTKAAGDADNDADVDADDLSVWQAQFGPPTNAATTIATSAAEEIDALAASNSRADVDSLFAAGDFTILFTDAKTTARRFRSARR